MRILLAEDDAMTRFMMAEMLEELDCEFDACGNGAEALQLVMNEPDKYAMILMDIHMPTLTGIDATRRIRESEENPPQKIPIFAITADQHWQSPSRVTEVGFNGVIPKPISLSGLERHLAKLRKD